MKILNLSETGLVAGGNSNPNFDLWLAAKEGALSGLAFGVPLSLALGGLIAYNAYYDLAPNASYSTAAYVALGTSAFMIAAGTLGDTALAYFQYPVSYIFY